MGYTHHWWRPLEIDPEQFRLWRDDVESVIHAGGVQIRGWDGKNEPGISDQLVSFNGDADANQSVETFHVPRVAEPRPWETATTFRKESDGTMVDLGPILPGSHGTGGFCKTNREPYDVVVIACLIALQHRVPEVCVMSDGDIADWISGGILLTMATGEMVPLMLGCPHDDRMPGWAPQKIEMAKFYQVDGHEHVEVEA